MVDTTKLQEEFIGAERSRGSNVDNAVPLVGAAAVCFSFPPG